MITHPTVIGASGPKSKSKKRPKSSINNPTSPDIEGAATTVRRKGSIKKPNGKKNCNQVRFLNFHLFAGSLGVISIILFLSKSLKFYKFYAFQEGNENMASPLDSLESPQTVRSMGTDSLPSPYDSASLYTNAFTQIHNLENGMIGKQPPSYEEGALQTLHALGLDPSFNAFGLPFRDIAHQVRDKEFPWFFFSNLQHSDSFNKFFLTVTSETDVFTGSDSGVSHSFTPVQ